MPKAMLIPVLSEMGLLDAKYEHCRLWRAAEGRRGGAATAVIRLVHIHTLLGVARSFAFGASHLEYFFPILPCLHVKMFGWI